MQIPLRLRRVLSAAFLMTPFAALLLLSCGRNPAAAAAHRTDTLRVSAGDSLLTIMAVGDIMLGSTWPASSPLPPNDGAEMLAGAKAILSAADITFGNLEGPLIDGGKSTKCREGSTDCYAFRMPTRYVRHLKDAGFDVMGIANNHAMDFGQAGRESTMRVLDSAGILHSGPQGDIARLTIQQRRIALAAFGYDDDSHNLNDGPKAEKLIRALKKDCDILIVSLHGGGEGASRRHVPFGHEKFLGEDRGDLRSFTHLAVDAGADLVLGHGPHVVRGMELYKERLIAYSLGNFATWGQFTLTGPSGVSLILEVSLNPDGSFHSGRIHPIRQDKPGGARLDSSRAVIPMLRELSEEDFPGGRIVIDSSGAIGTVALPPP